MKDDPDGSPIESIIELAHEIIDATCDGTLSETQRDPLIDGLQVLGPLRGMRQTFRSA